MGFWPRKSYRWNYTPFEPIIATQIAFCYTILLEKSLEKSWGIVFEKEKNNAFIVSKIKINWFI